jgi:hypothetical protein
VPDGSRLLDVYPAHRAGNSVSPVADPHLYSFPNQSRIPLVGAAVLFIILHRRHVRRMREEDANDRHRSLDFGLGDVPQPGGKRKKRGIAGLSFTQEKSARAQRQMSMDMGMSSPYLLPPELQESRESLHSLSRTIHNQEDPYRPVQFHDAVSLRSHPKGFDAGSTYTGSSNAYSHAPSKLHEASSADLLSNAAKMSRSNSPMNMNTNGNEFVPPPRTKSLSSKNAAAVPPKEEELPALPYPSEPEPAHVQMPSISGDGLSASSLPGSGLGHLSDSSRDGGDANNAGGLRHSNNYLGSFINEQDLERAANKADEEKRVSPPVGLPANPRPPRKESTNSAKLPYLAFEEDYGEGFKVTPPSPTPEDQHMREHRYSMDVPPEEFVHAGLGAPGFDARRLSMGFRPLPPDAITEVDDPEVRANRIRSFYKEYFDETKPAPEGQYYEDYDENYLGDAAYYDVDHNNFVMPYAQPVTRRAMTPPPRGPPRGYGPPRGAHGSMGGMSLNGMGMGGMGGMGGGFRGVPGPRAYSSASAGPRSYSSASQRMPGGGFRKPMPPPAALPTLPTPSKLRDDSFAIFNAADFAPPTTYRERVAGRSESPLGERRPYSPAVPSFVPTASAFDELASMPSP